MTSTKQAGLVLAMALAAGAAAAAGPTASQQPQTAGGAGTQSPAAPDSKSASLMGQVIDADTGAPIPGAMVRLAMRAAAAAPARGAAGAPNAGPGGVPAAAAPTQMTVLTDGEGRFLFHDLPKGNAALTASASGYMSPPGVGGRGVANRPVPIGDGEHVFDQKLRLVRAATISGTIVDENGEPAVGFEVRAIRRDAPGQPNVGAMPATTDDRGMYRLRGLPPGAYIVAVPQTQITVPAQAADDLVNSLASGSMGAILGDLMSSGGPQVMSAMGGMRVGNQMWSSGAGQVGSANLGGLGGVPQMAPSARPPGPVPPATGRMLAYQTVFYPSAATPGQAQVITVKSGDNRDGVDFQVRLTPASRVSGTVTGPAGPVRNMAVHLVAVAAGDLADNDAFETATALTAADGSFTMLGVPPGQYVLKAEKQAMPDLRAMLAQSPDAASMPPELANFLPTGSRESLSARATVGVGDTDVNGIALTLTPGAHISGRLEFLGAGPKPTAKDMQQLTVMTTPVSGGGASMGFSQDAVDAAGQFTTAGFAPGRYVVSVTPVRAAMTPNNFMLNWMVKSISAGGRDITNDAIDLGSTDITDLLVTYTDQISQLAGTVRPPATGKLDKVSVVFVPADYKTFVASGLMAQRSPVRPVQPNGAFTIGRIAPGDYLVVAVDDAVLEATQDVTFYERLARVATRVTLAEGEKKNITLDVTKVVR